MHENRPPNWDWVKATGECTATNMFSKLHELARRDIQKRNEQLGKEQFIVSDNESGFWVDRSGVGLGTHIWFNLHTESEIRVKARDEEVIYAVNLDDMGCCKLWSAGQSLDPWQVLKLALEPLLF